MEHIYRETDSTSVDHSGMGTHIPLVTVPESYLVINCPCGEEHRISLNELPSSTSRRSQVEQKCEYARHFIVHTGHSRYRKILIVSEFGEQ